MFRRTLLGLSLMWTFACHSSTPASTNFDAMMKDSVFSIDVPGAVPTGPVLGDAGSYDVGPGGTPTKAFRVWNVSRDPDETYARALATLTKLGVTLTFASCTGPSQPNYIGGGWKIVGDRGTDVNVSLQGDRLQVYLSSSPGPPEGFVKERHLLYDGSCPMKTDRLLRSLTTR